MSRKSSKKTRQTKVQTPVQAEAPELAEIEQQIDVERTLEELEPITDELIADIEAQTEETIAAEPIEEVAATELAETELATLAELDPGLNYDVDGESANLPDCALPIRYRPPQHDLELQSDVLPANSQAPEEGTLTAGDAEATAGSAPEAKPEKPKRPAKTAPKKLSALDAAAQVLGAAGKPMTCAEMIEEMSRQGLWSSPNGATPAATLYSAILRELKKGAESRFEKTERGKFAAKGA
jgi:hypothetical protein